MNKHLYLSRLLIHPDFKPIPHSTLADVEENIVNWISKGYTHHLNEFCRPCDKCPNGYRFIRSEDLDETIITHQTIKGVDFEIKWFRRLHAKNLSFYPLWFSEWYTECTLTHNDVSFEFKSDNDLKKRIKEMKKIRNSRIANI